MKARTFFPTSWLWVALGAAAVSPSLAAIEKTSHAATEQNSQSATARVSRVANGVWLDEQGHEVALFGVNYAQPFAFGYRAVAAKGLSHRDVMAMDVAHLKRLGVRAYRVHLWDRLLSDRDGNLLNNEHLALFDELLEMLRDAGIRVVITPIGWWGSGYPAPDPTEPGFSALYSKNDMNEKSDAINATHTYLRQLMAHVNKAGYRYADDPNILAFELFNEPKHRQDPAKSAAYVSDLVKVLREAGVRKPLFYNTSEQGNWPEFASALCQTPIDGVSYQWYPTGLLHMSERHGNWLGSVARYSEPFAALDGCTSKARMVYEFDAADVAAPVMYPAMARSFRQAGFQWATQFAYDSAELADSNAEYNTHHLNLLYTPSKAISLLIAGQVFSELPRGDAKANSQASKQAVVADYPASNLIETPLSSTELTPPRAVPSQAGDSAANTASAAESGVAVYQSASAFYYSGSTAVTPRSKDISQIAGVGSSALVQYGGTGAYFIDRQADGSYLLELYPDVATLQDPYQASSLARQAAVLQLNQQPMQLKLPGLADNAVATPLAGPALALKPQPLKHLQLLPGVYRLAAANAPAYQGKAPSYHLPGANKAPTGLLATHQGPDRWQQQQALPLCVNITAPRAAVLSVRLYHRFAGDKWQAYQTATDAGQGQYCASVPAAQLNRSGVLQYRFAVEAPSVVEATLRAATSTDAANTGVAPTASSASVSSNAPARWLTTSASGSSLVWQSGWIVGKPDDWDFADDGRAYGAKVQAAKAPVLLFSGDDSSNLAGALVYPKDAKTTLDWRLADEPVLRVSVNKTGTWLVDGVVPLLRTQLQRQQQLAYANATGTASQLLPDAALKLRLKVRMVRRGDGNEPLTVGVALLDQDGLAWGSELPVSTQWQVLQVPVATLQPLPTLLSEAYPTFLPAQLQSATRRPIDARYSQGVQWWLPSLPTQDVALEIAEVSLVE